MTKAQFYTYVDGLLPDNVVGAISAADLRTIMKNLAGQLYDDYAAAADLTGQGPRQIWLKPSNGQPATTNSESVYHNGQVLLNRSTDDASGKGVQIGGGASVVGGLNVLNGAKVTPTTAFDTSVRPVNSDGGFAADTINELGNAKLHFAANWVPGSSDFGFILTNFASQAFTFWKQTAAATKELWLTIRSGRVGIGINNPTSSLHIIGVNGHTQLRLETSYTPTGTADANGAIGQIAWDASYIYVKTAAGWKRSALTTF